MQTITGKARVLHPKPGCLVICLPRIHQVGAAMGGALGVAASPFLGGKPQEHSESPPPSPNYRYAILGLISRKMWGFIIGGQDAKSADSWFVSLASFTVFIS